LKNEDWTVEYWILDIGCFVIVIVIVIVAGFRMLDIGVIFYLVFLDYVDIFVER